ncbi:hypothetical protein SJAG_05347 [Schizosaccharomyces japonicus yFS275]|uniref:Uncharacterized protein n=1 Tax=Schizosaccharomyces japonicus (strain yFS275 / FY16936) TaxID=402676 RepID=B6K858_SCHJY|nr:hypothetical protein SJAG_05347 [Schizosaccharomyces japonicus yFS275]EEB09712.1 hypothetical protein SJAG_05347 [Schizosaccharomyces japonicus yFS275]
MRYSCNGSSTDDIFALLYGEKRTSSESFEVCSITHLIELLVENGQLDDEFYQARRRHCMNLTPRVIELGHTACVKFCDNLNLTVLGCCVLGEQVTPVMYSIIQKVQNLTDNQCIFLLLLPTDFNLEQMKVFALPPTTSSVVESLQWKQIPWTVRNAPSGYYPALHSLNQALQSSSSRGISRSHAAIVESLFRKAELLKHRLVYKPHTLSKSDLCNISHICRLIDSLSGSSVMLDKELGHAESFNTLYRVLNDVGLIERFLHRAT